MVWWPRHTVGSIRFLSSPPPTNRVFARLPLRVRPFAPAEWRNTRRSVSGLWRAGPTVLCLLPPRARATFSAVAVRRLRRRRVPIAIFHRVPLLCSRPLASPTGRRAVAVAVVFNAKVKATHTGDGSQCQGCVHRTRPPPPPPPPASPLVLHRSHRYGPRRHPAADVPSPPRLAMVRCVRARPMHPTRPPVVTFLLLRTHKMYTKMYNIIFINKSSTARVRAYI